MRDLRLMLTLLLVASVTLVSACGEPPVDDQVHAVNFESGERQSFASAGDVPDGWAICSDPSCGDIHICPVPCEDVPVEYCDAVPGCRLEEYYPYPLPEPLPLPEPHDPSTDVPHANGGFDGPGRHPRPGRPKHDCWPQPEYRCVSDVPPPVTCYDLGPDQCERHPALDCVLQPTYCPFWCAQDDVDCHCEDVCVPRFDRCPAIDIAPPVCDDGSEPKPIFDDQGCLIGYEECPVVPTTCDELVHKYAELVEDLKQCSPFAFRAQCTEVVLSVPGCGCPTSVNSDRVEDIALLARMERHFYELGCHKKLVCPAVLCAPTAAGSCERDGNGGGRCADVYEW